MSLSPPERLDLRGTPCPLNYIRTRLALEKLPAGAELEVWLDRGEPERLVSEGLRQEGHAVVLVPMEGDAVQLTVCAAAAGSASHD
jgi:TusA-related sulfurtransferase